MNRKFTPVEVKMTLKKFSMEISPYTIREFREEDLASVVDINLKCLPEKTEGKRYNSLNLFNFFTVQQSKIPSFISANGLIFIPPP